MIEQEQNGLLYLVKLNSTSFEQNPGKIDLPKGRYVVEIREGVFSYKLGHAADVEVAYRQGSKKRLRLPDFGRFNTIETAQDVYQGMSVEFVHDGGEIEVYNPRPAKQYHGKILGGCVIGIWDGKMFGSPGGRFEPEDYKPVRKDSILVLTSNPKAKPHKEIGKNITWQSDLRDYGKHNAIVIPPESFSFLYKIRDKNCLGPYVKSGGRVFLVGSALQYLSYNNTIPFDIPWYLGTGKYNTIAASVGDKIVGKSNFIKMNTSLTIPLILSDDNGKVAHLHSSDKRLGKAWCAAKKKSDRGKVVWTSFFLMDYKNTENWNNMILDQIGWLMK